ncbi:MAG: hypothetical protein KAW14_04690 [Candidatus Aegiribacteria sp.]|nr:hypothetical protein [Candidatus Aegiribacteria sp.]
MDIKVISMKLIAVSFVLLASSAVYGDYWYGDFTDDRTVVFSNTALVFSYPDVDCPQAIRLPMGTELGITGSSGKDSLPDGMPFYWYEATFEYDGVECTGYIPGPDLAMTSLTLGGDTLFVFTVTGFNPEEYCFIAAARIISSDEILAEQVFRPVSAGSGQSPYSYCIRGMELQADGFTGIENLIELSFTYEACGYENRDVLFACTGTDLVMGPHASSQFEAGCYHFNETFVLPTDSGGADNEVTIEGILEEWDNDADDYVETQRTSVTYIWNGEVFISGE